MNKSHIIIKAVGDICPGDMSILGLGICSQSKKNGIDYPFESAKKYLRDADIVIGNLEGILTSKAYVKILRFCGVPEFAKALKTAGFTVLSVANNHIFEQGISGFNETVKALEEQGILICGCRGEAEFYSKPVIINTKGKIVGILSYNWVGVNKFTNADKYIAQSYDSVVNYTWNRDAFIDRKNQEVYLDKNSNVLSDIRRLKKTVDYVVVIPHWGFEFVHVPPYGVVLEGRSFIDAGADCIIGSHPHVLQGNEEYKGKNIFYSLGNFVFDMPVKESMKTALLKISIYDQGNSDYSYTFLKINKKYQPVPASSSQEAEMIRIIDKSNAMVHGENLSAMLNDDVIYKEYERQYNRQKAIDIIRLFYILPIHPFVLLVIIKKIANFAEIMMLRVKGKKIRW
jgi:poly-gamma-glutamate capsule biosynthesis protein CapA/YwtB (metallophosphatase superfamily)